MILDMLLKAGLGLIILGMVLNIAGLLTWVERKQSALMQDRIGANRAAIFGFTALGLLHGIADAVKMFTKEDCMPKGAHRFIFNLAPAISVAFAMAAFAAIPFGNTLTLFSRTINLQVAELDAALLFVLAAMSIAVYGVILAGFSSNSNYAVLGGMRAASQMLSYEMSMGLSILGLVLLNDTMNLQEMVRAQGGTWLGFIPRWGVFTQPLAFLVFTTAVLAETKRAPFDLPEGESEIIGYFVEYSGMKFGMFLLTDFIETVLAACLVSVFFFGGWQIPGLHATGFHFPWGTTIPLPPLAVSLLGVAAMMTKVVFFNWLFMALRWTLPRFRYDQLMHLGWKILLPASIANVLVTAAWVAWRG